MKGDQINATAGLTRKLTPDFLIGAFGGYEHFDYSSDALNGRLKGDGWTVGSYLGWRLNSAVRLDLAVARSGIDFNGTAGTATGTFPAGRWLVSSGLTGTYRWQALVLQPSARVYALWEHESAYTDSLGTLQTERNFSTGRASAGAKVGYPFVWTSTISLALRRRARVEVNELLACPTQAGHAACLCISDDRIARLSRAMTSGPHQQRHARRQTRWWLRHTRTRTQPQSPGSS